MCRFNSTFDEVSSTVRNFIYKNNIEDSELDYSIKAYCKATFKDEDFLLKQKKKDTKEKVKDTSLSEDDVVTGF